MVDGGEIKAQTELDFHAMASMGSSVHATTSSLPYCVVTDHHKQNQVKKEYYKPYYEATESMFIKPRELHP